MPLTAALMMSVLLPTNVVLANETSTEEKSASVNTAETSEDTSKNKNDELFSEIPTLVEAEMNEGELNNFLLEDYFVTAERIPTKRLATPANVTVITAEEIAANHYQNIYEALSHVNGVVTALERDIPTRILSINGNDRILLLMDGRRTFITPPMKMIERIEIVKGGGSALYGSDAVGGVVNIITKKGDHNETTIDLNTGSWHRHKYEITNQGNDGTLGWFIDASISKSQPYKSRGYNPGDERSDYDDDDVALKLDHRFDDRNSLTFDIMHRSHHYNKYTNYGAVADNPFVFSWDYTPKYELFNQVSVSYNFKEGTTTPGFLRYFNNYYASDLIFWSKGNSRLQGVDYQNGWESGQHKIIVGAEWHQSSDIHQYINFGSNKKKVTNQAYYLQDTISMGNKWTVIPGTRFDHHSQFGSQWSPKIAANYSPDEKTKIYASWGRVYKAPSAQELYTDYWRRKSWDEIPLLFQSWRGNKNLRPETGHTETIGIEHDFSDKVNMALSLFNTKISDYLDLNDTTTIYPNAHYPYIFYYNEYNYINASADKQRGIDLTYRQKIDDHWSYNLGYAYTHCERPLGEEDFLSHLRIPKNSYRAAVKYQNGPWKASLMAVMGNGSSGNLYMEDNFALLDFNVSCAVSDWATIYAKAINFTNQNRYYYGRNSNAPGRLFQIGLDCSF